MLSRVQLCVTPWTAARQAPLSMGFSRQEYGSGLPFPPPGDFPNPEAEPRSPSQQADSLPSATVIKSLTSLWLNYNSLKFWASLVAQLVKNLPAMRETWL